MNILSIFSSLASSSLLFTPSTARRALNWEQRRGGGPGEGGGEDGEAINKLEKASRLSGWVFLRRKLSRCRFKSNGVDAEVTDASSSSKMMNQSPGVHADED